jgi:hypothetical protein
LLLGELVLDKVLQSNGFGGLCELAIPDFLVVVVSQRNFSRWEELELP